MDGEDEIISTLPVHYSNALAPGLQLHQFPLLNRPLHVPPSAAASGKKITSRMKTKVRKIEIHVPADTRPEVWNKDRGNVLGQAQIQDDREKNQEQKTRDNVDPRLSEVRLQSDTVPHKGAHMLGIVRDGQLHLHPITETHQLRPTLTYLDVMNRKGRRQNGAGSDSDSDDGPPPDPDEAPPPPSTVKREKKSTGETREVHVTAKRSDDKNSAQNQGGLSAARRDILRVLREEDDDEWRPMEFCDVTSSQSEQAFDRIFSTSGKELVCKSDVTLFLKDIHGL